MRPLLAGTLRTFTRNDGRMLAGATAFFGIVSVAPLFVVALVVAGRLTGERAAQAELIRGAKLWIGPDGAGVLRALLENVRASADGRGVTLASLAVVVWGAGKLFRHLQRALDHLWGVRLRDDRAMHETLLGTLRRTAWSFALVFACAVALLASVGVRSAIVAMRHVRLAPAHLHWRMLDHAGSFVVLSALFAMVFRVLPSVRIRWRQALEGGVITAALFAVGRVAVAAWIGRTSLRSTFGAAGSLVVLLVWTYWSAQIFYLGAAFIAERARLRGETLEPDDDAEVVR